ncbi:MAG: class I adenylate-forming enzyme family protein [Stellaceae bacterium]
MQFVAMILHHARSRPEKPAVIMADRVATYGMMAQGILGVSARLAALNLAPGALVSIAIDSPIRALIVAAACYRLGLPTLMARRTAEIAPVGLPIALHLEGSSDAMAPGLHQVLVEDDWFTGAPDTEARAGFAHGDAICRVDLSSGVTGTPKTLGSPVATFEGRLGGYTFSVGQGHLDRMLCLPPLASGWGFTIAAHALFLGKTLVFAPTARDALLAVAVYQVDCLIASPLHLRQLLDAQQGQANPLPSLGLIFTGGALPTRALLDEARAGLCRHIVVQYGSTEAGASAYGPSDRLAQVEGAVGFVAPWAEVEAVDDDGNLLPPGQDGILRIRSNVMARPYFDANAPGAEAFADGWFYPGDRGHVTGDGMMVVAGRIAEIMVVGGQAQAPEVIEEIARRHPAVADVAAVGIARPAGGADEIYLAVVPRGAFETAALVAHCAAQGRPVDRVVTMSEIPRTALGKVARDRLKRALASHAELDVVPSRN